VAASADTGVKSYDLRKLIEDVTVIAYDRGMATMRMLLRCDASGSGRPEQVSRALGLDTPLEIHRTRLVLSSA